MGNEVKDLNIGDEVMGVVPPQSGTGSHAQYVVVPDSCVVLKPSNLTMIQAASIPYAGLTAWSGITSLLGGNLSDTTNNREVKVLVMGAAGGVGCLAIQLCKLFGCMVRSFEVNVFSFLLLFIASSIYLICQVVATCATDAVPIIEPLGSDYIVDYRSPDADSRLKQFGGYLLNLFNDQKYIYIYHHFTALGLISYSIVLVVTVISI